MGSTVELQTNIHAVENQHLLKWCIILSYYGYYVHVYTKGSGASEAF